MEDESKMVGGEGQGEDGNVRERGRRVEEGEVSGERQGLTLM